MDIFKLEIFCQPNQKEQVLNTLHQHGVDRVGNYDHCWAISMVEGSHRALDDAKPVFGASGLVESYPLVKVEITINQPLIPP
ncbi:hypothetical protein [Veronia pacifica]|uniref:hypothetical protein n=1 Tax=Veronia pacifica TaxID=1080227 RepID=UPI001FE15FE3|nr:hypothetical protein [Veronia pacifica]